MKYILFLFSIVFIFRVNYLEYSDMPLYSIMAMTLLFMIGFLGLIFAGSHYLKLIIDVGNKKTVWPYFLLLGFWSLSMMISYDYDLILKDIFLLGLLIIILLVFIVLGESVIEFVTKKFSLKRDIRMFTRCNPPEKRSDIYRGDFTMVLISLMPIFAEIIHG